MIKLFEQIKSEKKQIVNIGQIITSASKIFDKYVDVIGGGDHPLPLGSRFFAKNGLKCIGRNGSEVDAYNYYSNYNS
jgi:hypothetical protein